jgi:two-component system, NtrC family, nitrogen regulation sensor histidine kinase NtrY
LAEEDIRGRMLADVVPEMADLLNKAAKRPHRLREQTIGLPQQDGTLRRLLVRIAVEVDRRKIIGFVVTFDDITELASAQRKAAWADVARRIAHEIKNPLTPIQLSAERLKRKYLEQITTDRETFETCTDIIVRQVGDIGRMVDEFTAFARLPAPSIAPENLGDMIQQALFLQRGAHPDVEFIFEPSFNPVIVPCDRDQIGRALTNLFQNAVDAIERRAPDGTEPLIPGRVTVTLIDDGTIRAIAVEDNGPGFPRTGRHQLTEPYVTTRAEGTGLGLAIVTKIMEDHGGNIRLEDSPAGGARVCLVFPLSEDHANTNANIDTRDKTDSGMKRKKMRAHGT